MRPMRPQRGNALVMVMIVLLVITAGSIAIMRFAAREVTGAHAGRKEAAVSACAEAARGLLMGRWKLLGTHDLGILPVSVTLESANPTVAQGGHYGQDPNALWDATNQVWLQQVQVIALNPTTVGPSSQSNDLSNRIGDTILPYRVVVHCTQGTAPDARELELEFAVQYGI